MTSKSEIKNKILRAVTALLTKQCKQNVCANSEIRQMPNIEEIDQKNGNR